MKHFQQKIGVGFLALMVGAGLGWTQDIGTPNASQGLTTAEFRALNNEGNPKKRAEKAIKLANKKADEARKAALKGNAAEAENAGMGYEAALGHALNGIHQAEGQGADLTNTLAKVSEATSKHNSKLAEAWNRVPDQAKPHVEHAMEVSQRGHDEALGALERAATREQNPQRRARALLDVADGRAAQAQEAARRGDSETAGRAAQGYERALGGTLAAIHEGQQQGHDMEAVMNRVAEATMRHQGKLEEVQGRVPEEAQEAVARAREVSMRGHETALANLERARAQRAAATAERGGYGMGSGRAPAGVGGGAPGGIGGGAPAGVGSAGARGGGPPAGVGRR
ncbi:MAG: hypothetical protein HYS38_09050 [Acidobacteria bacterium]|nr:hypothetical protein [Acidobacteriota bacterium]